MGSYINYMLTSFEKDMLMKRFPNIELSYNKNIYRKVYAEYYSIIPKGPKSIMWFTYINDKNICVVLILDRNDNIKSITRYLMCFDSKLSYGTVIYGTFIKTDRTPIFCFEKMHFYKGIDVQRCNPIKQLKMFQNIFLNEISQKTYEGNFIIPVLPIMDNSYNNICKIMNNITYNVYGIRYFRNNTELGIEKVNIQPIQSETFIVMASINADIYNLFCQRNNKEYLIGYALIQSYKKSVFMNSIFRKIKENSNLDYLEESDSDDEFENINPFKFVDLNKKVVMKCTYNKNFKKWEPVEEINNMTNYCKYEKIKHLC